MNAAANLKDATPEMVRKYATDIGLKPHPRAGKEKMLALIEAALDGNEIQQEGDDLPEVKAAPVDELPDFTNPDAIKFEDEPVIIPEDDEIEGVVTEVEKTFVETPKHTAVQTAKGLTIAQAKAQATPATARAALAFFAAKGGRIVHMDNEYWELAYRNHKIAGTMNMPLSTLVQEARILTAPTKVARDDGSSFDLNK